MSNKTLADALEKLMEERDALSRAYDRMQDKRNRALDQRDEIAALVDELRQDCNQLEKERDAAQAAIAAAEFDRDWFRSERDDWKRDAELSNAQADSAYVERDKAKRAAKYWYSRSLDFGKEWAELRAERDRLRAGQDRWEGDTERVSAEVIRQSKPGSRFRDQGASTTYQWDGYRLSVIGFDATARLSSTTPEDLEKWGVFLLADAPTDDAGDEDRRLTVHDLDAAPVGAWLVNNTRASQKLKNGMWGFPGLAGTRTSEEMVAMGWDTARLETGCGDE